MKLTKLLTAALMGFVTLSAMGAEDKIDSEGYPVMYVRGDMTNNWSVQEAYKFTRTGDTYTIKLASLNGQFKISGTEWINNYGNQDMSILSISDASTFEGAPNGGNLNAKNLNDVTIKFDIKRNGEGKLLNTFIQLSANGKEAPEIPSEDGFSGTLPVLYINVYEEDGATYNDEIISRNLDHKNYFKGEYWLDLNGCEWMEAEGAASIGSKENPLPLEIKARGNFTRIAFAKKPFKLKLGAKQSMLGLSKSKHFALLAHADDNYGYLRNFTGFNLGRRIQLPWTPWQQPVEVVINGDYRGLYFLTESIRIEKNRVDIEELDDEVSDPALISGGYLIELDNYDEENQIRMTEKTFVGGYTDVLRITWDTPELYSEIQKRFVTEQFSQMNDYIGSNNDLLWGYMQMDDAARYYLVEEIISNVEAYHGSTYMFRNRGEGQKWHFSPLWDCGNAFNGPTNGFFYNHAPYGSTWIPSIRANAKFNAKVKETWLWFMNTRYDGIINDIDTYVSHIAEAAKADAKRWANAPKPNNSSAMDVVNNSDMTARRNAAVARLQDKINWLITQFGDYKTAGVTTEPALDTTPAAPLPDYAGIENISVDNDIIPTYYNLQGIHITNPTAGQIYIVRRGNTTTKEVIR